MNNMPNFDDEFRFLDYFSGLVDGEGCFTITKHGNKGKFHVRFSIRLRADDIEILNICKNIMRIGNIYMSKAEKNNLSNNPFADYIISDVAECMKLIDVLDVHSLRAKKKLDYLIWRDAVMYRAKNMGRQGVAHSQGYIIKMESYREQLSKVKKYDSSVLIELSNLRDDSRQSSLF
jgi:hypothetical protein